jgi:hypothetical protein
MLSWGSRAQIKNKVLIIKNKLIKLKLTKKMKELAKSK